MKIHKNKQNSEHYKWGDNCDGWHLLKNQNLHIIEEKMPPGTSEKKHYHEFAQQFFYVLKGMAHFWVDGKEIEVSEREGIHIPPGKIHQVVNSTDFDLEFLVISQPTARGDRVNL